MISPILLRQHGPGSCGFRLSVTADHNKDYSDGGNHSSDLESVNPLTAGTKGEPHAKRATSLEEY